MVGRTTGDTSSVKGLPVTVIASRGGSYAPDTPREASEYVQNYLRSILNEYMGLPASRRHSKRWAAAEPAPS